MYGPNGITLGCGKPSCETYPFTELNRLARRLKLDHPADRAVLIKTADNVAVQHFVSTLDALRDDSLSGRRRVEMFIDPILHHEAFQP